MLRSCTRLLGLQSLVRGYRKLPRLEDLPDAHLLPSIALVGRPNVGKSALFNRLVHRREALVFDTPGGHVTRDYREGLAQLGDLRFRVIDTSGLEPAAGPTTLQGRAAALTRGVLNSSHGVVMLLDARQGVVPGDEELLAWLRRNSSRPLLLVANKADTRAGSNNLEQIAADLAALGHDPPVGISATSGDGLADLYQLLQPLVDAAAQQQQQQPLAPAAQQRQQQMRVPQAQQRAQPPAQQQQQRQQWQQGAGVQGALPPAWQSLQQQQGGDAGDEEEGQQEEAGGFDAAAAAAAEEAAVDALLLRHQQAAGSSSDEDSDAPSSFLFPPGSPSSHLAAPAAAHASSAAGAPGTTSSSEASSSDEDEEGLSMAGSSAASTAAAAAAAAEGQEGQGPLRLAILGLPNVGKSTLMNSLLGYERSLTGPEPGLTRDPTYGWIKHGPLDIQLVDTAGWKRATAMQPTQSPTTAPSNSSSSAGTKAAAGSSSTSSRGRTEAGGQEQQAQQQQQGDAGDLLLGKQLADASLAQARRALGACHVAVLLLDAARLLTIEQAITRLELQLAGLALDQGKALVIALNKSDLVPGGPAAAGDLQDQVAQLLEDRFLPAGRLPVVLLSALEGRGTEGLLDAVTDAYAKWNKKVSSHKLRATLAKHSVRFFGTGGTASLLQRIKWAVQLKLRPPTFVLLMRGAALVDEGGQRFLANVLRQSLRLQGVPLRLYLRYNKRYREAAHTAGKACVQRAKRRQAQAAQERRQRRL